MADDFVTIKKGTIKNTTCRILISAALTVLSACGGDGGDAASLNQNVARLPTLPPDVPAPLASLKKISVPKPPDLDDYIRDKEAAVKLGKALFWDMQVGSDGIQACASCHFRAGADPRSKNQLNPGNVNHNGTTFEVTRPNGQLKAEFYPFHKLADVNDRHSTVLSDADDVTGSQGVFLTNFDHVNLYQAAEAGQQQSDPVFPNLRRVEPRNTPTMINAVFNFRNFWDGRAQNEFNGVSPFGRRDHQARVLYASSPQALKSIRISIINSALASQAVGPPLSNFEMSFSGRIFPDIGKKMLSLPPLAKQQVSQADSVLGKLSNAPDPGISTAYADLIKQAFVPEFWQSALIVTVDATGHPVSFAAPHAGALQAREFTQMQYNFSLFFGLAIQMYESTLVADDTPFDQFMDGNATALSTEQKRGMAIFTGKGKCINCHAGAELTKASVRMVRDEKIERMIMGDGGCAIYDNGFYNIGVRRTGEDLGLGGRDPFGNALSMTRLAQLDILDNIKLTPPLGTYPTCDERANVNGTFKVPGLRNVELTAPYFHNGGQRTLRQVVDFYNRGGDFHEANIANLDPDIQYLGLSDGEKEDLVAFLISLTDERVRHHRAPFDHPQLFVPDGQVESNGVLVLDANGRAQDIMRTVDATGKYGGPKIPGSFLYF